ncbi:MAG: hypothetical protein ABW221_12950 [Vicinamibacteria bacterium]
MTDAPDPRTLVPARRTPLAYLAFGHACLLTALVTLALDPVGLGGFYYHPRLIAVVHLVTLGFVTSAILGTLYIACPLAFRVPLPERWTDLAAAFSWMVGVSGIASHFWMGEYSGMAWSGAMALATPLWVGVRVLAGLRRSVVPLAARLPIGFAIVNLYVAGALGVTLGVNKHALFLPFSQLDAVHAHLHLGAVGFALLMVVGAGYRILPMVLPSAMPRGAVALASPLVVQAGTWGLVLSLLFAKAAVAWCAAVVLAGVGLFLSRVAFMLSNRRPPPRERARADGALVLVLQALVYLVVACGLGAFLAWVPTSEGSLRAAFAYGVAGLLGFFCSLVLGVEARLVPLAAWLQGFTATGQRPASIHTAVPRDGALTAAALWTVGVPCLAAGLGLDRPLWTQTGAGALAVAVSIAAGSGVAALIRLRR